MNKILVNLLFILLGISVLAPWTCISTCLEYFSKQFLNIDIYFISNLPANVAAVLFSIISLWIKKEKKFIKLSLECMMVCLILLPLFSYMVQKNSGIINVLMNIFLNLLEFM